MCMVQDVKGPILNQVNQAMVEDPKETSGEFTTLFVWLEINNHIINTGSENFVASSGKLHQLVVYIWNNFIN